MIVRTYEELEFFVRMFGNGNCDLLVIVSNGGYGKSRLVDDVMKDVRHVKLNGHVTPLGLYLLGYNNKDLSMVIDDIDSLLDNNDIVALLKQFAETSEVKRINWVSTTKLLEDVPKSYETRSKILIICNNLDILSKKLSPLLDRGWVIAFQPTTEELLRKMEQIRDTANGISFEERQEILDLISKFVAFGNVTLRTFVKGVQLRKECNGSTNWKDKLLNEMCINPRLIVMDSLLQNFNSDKERLSHWTGSRSSYYELKSHLVQKSATISNIRIHQ